MLETKICRSCGRELPATYEYFQKRSDRKDGLRTKCRECRGYDFKPLVPQGYKQCHKCLRILPIDNFNKAKDAPDGLQRKCKDCKHQYNMEHKEHMAGYNKKYREEHRDKLLQSAKEWGIENKELRKQYRLEHKAEIAEYNRKYQQEHKEYFLQWKRNHSAENWQKNKERYRPYQKEWWKAHRELSCMYSHRRRSRIKKLEATLTQEQWEFIKNYFNRRCAYCGKELPLTQDHFIPVANDGEYTHNNIIPACKSCNSSKHTKDFFEWYPRQKFYSKKREAKILKFLGYSQHREQQPALMM